jgi:hypothetical protein
MGQASLERHDRGLGRAALAQVRLDEEAHRGVQLTISRARASNDVVQLRLGGGGAEWGTPCRHSRLHGTNGEKW